MPAETAAARPGAPEQRARVFEAVNETRKEFLLGLWPEGATLDDLLSRHRRLPPSFIRHWRPEDRVSYRFIEAPSRLHEGVAFMRCLAITISIIGWGAFVDPAVPAS